MKENFGQPNGTQSVISPTLVPLINKIFDVFSTGS